PDMENILDEFLYKIDTPIAMEEVFVKETSWVVGRELKDLRLRDTLKVSVIGITENNGRFIQMPKAETMINANSKLLLVGSQSGIVRAKRILTLNKQPEDI
ncbi:TrkA C-terminal domain-containing protein, partial [Aliarcobacter butzleri]